MIPAPITRRTPHEKPLAPAFLSAALLFCLMLFGAACQVLPGGKGAPVSAEPALGAKKWELVELNGAPFPTTTDGERPHLIFLEDAQRVAGSAGCNRIMGSYTLRKDGSLELGPLATTMMACPDMEAEAAFLKALSEFGSTRRENGALLFFDEAGRTTVRLIATEPAE